MTIRRNSSLKHWTVCLLILCAVSVTRSDQGRQEACLAQLQPVSKVINHLGHTLTSQIGGTENLILSPLSVSLALGMVYLGARTTSASQMESSLLYDLTEGNLTSEDVHRQFKSLLTALGQGSDEYTILIANGMFPQTGYQMLPEFTAGLGTFYSAESDSLNYEEDGHGAMNSLNRWVSNKTRGKIEKLFETPLDPRTVLVLLNAVYFKGNWIMPFVEELTHERNFYGVNGTVKKVPFMEFRKRVTFYQDSETGYDFLELVYRGRHASMLFALPGSRETFPDLELTSEMICKIRAGLRRRKTQVFIPKFKLSYERELSQDMSRLGMDELFAMDEQRSDGDLSGIRQENDLFISLFKHSAVIEVNEQGSEAAGASGVGFHARSGHIESFSRFIADHPFLFAIIEKRTGAILFSGRLSDP